MQSIRNNDIVPDGLHIEGYKIAWKTGVCKRPAVVAEDMVLIEVTIVMVINPLPI